MRKNNSTSNNNNTNNTTTNNTIANNAVTNRKDTTAAVKTAKKKWDFRNLLGSTPEEREDSKKMLIGFGIAGAILLAIFHWFLMLSLIPSGSMEGTLKVGDVVISTRFDAKEIERYDICIFNAPDDPKSLYIKRVVGLPGETITVENGKVYADGVELDDSFLDKKMSRAGSGTYKVPEGKYFMMGDNRNHSCDSRFWDNKYVPAEEIEAKAKSIVFPFRRAGSLAYEGQES